MREQEHAPAAPRVAELQPEKPVENETRRESRVETRRRVARRHAAFLARRVPGSSRLALDSDARSDGDGRTDRRRDVDPSGAPGYTLASGRCHTRTHHMPLTTCTVAPHSTTTAASAVADRTLTGRDHTRVECRPSLAPHAPPEHWARRVRSFRMPHTPHAPCTTCSYGPRAATGAAALLTGRRPLRRRRS